MPGHLLDAKCNCGFERRLTPGATLSELYVIAYSADLRPSPLDSSGTEAKPRLPQGRAIHITCESCW